MENETELTSEQRRELYAAHERERNRFIANNTTPTERLQWLEDMLELFADRLPPRQQPYVTHFRGVKLDLAGDASVEPSTGR